MLRLFFILMFFHSMHVVCQKSDTDTLSKSVSCLVIDQTTKEVIPNILVIITKDFMTSVDSIFSDENGRFEFEFEKAISLEFKKSKYIEKELRCNKSEQLEVLLRSRDQMINSIDVDSTILNWKVKKLEKKYALEQSDLTYIFEPPGVCRGFSFELGDSSKLSIFINRTLVFPRLEVAKEVSKKRIIGFTVCNVDGRVISKGVGQPLVFYPNNKYRKE